MTVNTKTPLEIYQGETKNFVITVLDSNCDAVDITGYTLYFTVKSDLCDVLAEEVLIYKDSTNAAQIEIDADQTNNKGKATIKVLAADIAGMSAASYVYDVWLESPSGDRRLIAGPATFFIKQPVTLQFTAPPP